MGKVFKRTKGDNRIRRGYGIAFFLLLVAYFITFYSNRRLLKQSGLVEHTNKIIASLELMLSKLKDAETGVRGYVITKNIEFISPYYGSGKIADSLFYQVLQMTTDNPKQQERLGRLKKNIDRRFELFHLTIRTFDEDNREISDSLKQLQVESKKVMDEIRLGVIILQNEENRALEERGKNLKKTFVAVNTITFISLSLAFLLIIFGFITYIRENAGRKQAMKEIDDYQEQLKNRIDELNSANIELIRMRSHEKFAATGRIARNIAHEVRNPLTNINLAADQLKAEQFGQDENVSFLFEMITRNSARINQLISDLLNSTRFSELAYEMTSINSLLDEALLEARDRITLTEVEVVKKYSAGICEISVDKEKIKLVFVNIIINALEAMENKDGSVLTLETREENGKCKVIIRDNGIGMDSISVTRLFEPYFTSKPGGNGLGLANTQNIILNHKGEILVESVLGKGSSFIINFASGVSNNDDEVKAKT